MSSNKYELLGAKIGALVDEKDRNYGSAYHKSAEYLKLLFPNGVPPEKYADMLCLVQIWNKSMRIATNPHAYGENPYEDLIGYGLLGADLSQHLLDEVKSAQETEVNSLLPPTSSVIGGSLHFRA